MLSAGHFLRIFVSLENVLLVLSKCSMERNVLYFKNLSKNLRHQYTEDTLIWDVFS